MIGTLTIWRASIVCPCEREQSRDSSSFIILFQHKTELASAVVGNKGAPTPPVVNGSFSHRCNSSKAVFHHYISKEREYTTHTYIEWKQKKLKHGFHVVFLCCAQALCSVCVFVLELTVFLSVLSLITLYTKMRGPFWPRLLFCGRTFIYSTQFDADRHIFVVYSAQ